MEKGRLEREREETNVRKERREGGGSLQFTGTD